MVKFHIFVKSLVNLKKTIIIHLKDFQEVKGPKFYYITIYVIIYGFSTIFSWYQVRDMVLEMIL